MVLTESDGQVFVKRYGKKPIRYVREVLGVQTIEPWQLDVLGEIEAQIKAETWDIRIAIGSGHGVGKSALIGWIIHWFNAVFPDPQTVTTANTETQLSSKTWRELGIWNERAVNKDWFEHTATKFYLKAAPKTWFASAIPWTKNRSEAFAGTHAEYVLYVFDEASAIEDIIWEVSEGAMTGKHTLWIVCGNPTRATGRFRECFGKFKHRWKTFNVDARSVSFTNKAQIQKWIEDYGEDSDFVRVRVKGQIPRSGTFQFISSEDVEKCMERKEPASDMLALVMGVDLARSGACQTVFTFRQGRHTEPQIKFREPDSMQTVARIVAAIRDRSPDAVFLDGGGLGGPIIDRVKQLVGDEVVFEVNSGSAPNNKERYANKRAEMWGEMQRAIHQGMELPKDQELMDDLVGPEYFFTAKQQIQLERKEDMMDRGLASPDCGDSLALTFAQPVLKTHEEEEDYEEVGGRFSA